MASNLTDSQARAATTFDRHLVVTAGAGAGKTRVLIARIMGLLAEGKAELDQIVALTFTNKAAAEMKQRLRQVLQERKARATSEGRRQEAQVWERRKGELEQARITTIHGFCSQLLREYPVEAGVDPQFTILEEMDAGLVLHQALDEAFLTAAEQPDEGMAQLLDLYSRGALLQDLASAYAKLREHGLDPSRVWADTEASLEASRRELPALATAIAGAAGSLLSALQGKGGKAGRAAELAARWQAAEEALRSLTRIAAAGEAFPTDTLDQLAALEAVGRVVDRRSKSLLAEVDALRDSLEGFSLIVRGLLIAPAARTAASLLEQAHTRYQAGKKARGSLDFSDLQVLSRDLLARPEVSGDLRRRCPFLLVDEYQDTNPLQSEIIALWQPQNLFVVGDPKQSIYRFRGAEVEIFRQARRDIPAAGGEEVTLAENFRSREGLIRFVNFLFGLLMAEGYEAFEPRRQDLSGDVAVELLLPHPGETEAKGRRSDLDLEAAAVAARIRRMVQEGRPRVGEGEGRPVRYGDIALLFAATKGLAHYEQALRRQGVPYYVVSGRGFYSKQEVRDCLNLLRALDNPDDEVSLVGALRSPFFGLSDETLFWLAQPREQGAAEAAESSPMTAASWLARLEDPLPPHLDGDQQALVERARRLLSRFGRLKSLLPLADLIELVLQETDYALVALGGPDGEQILANLRKLVALARRFDAQGLSHLRDFIALVEEFEAREAREGEAAVQAAEGDTVKLMSIHQSKGLEFPVTFVVDLARDFPSARGVLFRPGIGLGLSLPAGESGQRLDTWMHRRLAEEEKRLSREESVRLFYVAATRAQDHLVLAGARAKLNTARDYAEMSCWLEWVSRALGLTDTAALEEQGPAPHVLTAPASSDAAPVVRVYLPAELQDWDGVGASPEGVIQPGRLLDLADLERALALAGSRSPSPPPAADLLEAPPAGARRYLREEEWPSAWSVTDFLTYEHCPRRFALERRLGLAGHRSPGGPAPGAFDRPGRGRRRSLDAITRGNLVHRVCEGLRHPSQLDGLLAQAVREAGLVAEGLAEAAAKEVRPLLARYLGSEVFRLIATGQSQAERSFQYRLRGTSYAVSGVIDNLVATADGRNLVVDFKTNNIGPDQVEATAAGYRLQVETYALVADRLLGSPVEEGWLYFLVPDACHKMPVRQTDLEAVEARLTALAVKMSRGLSLADFPPAVSQGCLFCPQREFCRAGGVFDQAQPDFKEVS